MKNEAREQRTVSIADIQVDESYQRRISAAKVAAIADAFDHTTMGRPLVAEREDGSLWIIDGHERLAALLRLGYASAAVDVVKSTGPACEADIVARKVQHHTKPPIDLN